MTATIRSSLITCDALLGADVEVRDVAEARPFYELLFASLPGQWDADEQSARFVCRGQTIRLIAVPKPSVYPDSGRHHAYRLGREQLDAAVDRLTAAGRAVDWWREDHPDEREVTAYVQDPSGNRIQLVPAINEDCLLDHLMVEVHDLELAEVFWVRVLGGAIDYYHGRRSRDYLESIAWGEGRDPCAPWTRLMPGAGIGNPERAQRRAAHPNQQLYLRLGAGRLGLVLSPRHRQEPPEEQIAGTPRVTFHTPARASEVVSALERRDVDLRPEDRLRIPWVQDGNEVSLRDPSGNFVLVACAGS